MNRREMADETGRRAPALVPSPVDTSNENNLTEARPSKARKSSRRARPGAVAVKRGRGEQVATPPPILVASSLRQAELRELLATHAEHRVSLYLPLHAPGAEGLQNSVRLKNLLREAQSQLVAHGLRPTDARAMLKPANSLLTNAAFWRQSEGGLALLIAPVALRCYHLPSGVAEEVHVGRRFIIRPLLPLLDETRRYWLLALSQNSVRLFRGHAEGIVPLQVAGLPRDMASALNLDMSITGDQVHSATSEPLGKQAAVFHGQGGETDTRKEELQEYFRAIDAALHDTLRAEPAPLLVACVGYEFALYREVNTYPHLIGRAPGGNVEHLGRRELHAQAWPLVEPHLDEARRETAARFARLAASGKTSSHITEIIPAAREGKIDTLFLARDAAVWGVPDAETGAVEVHRGPQPGDEDLLDLAAVETLTHHGAVYSVAAAEMPASGPAAAIMRY